MVEWPKRCETRDVVDVEGNDDGNELKSEGGGDEFMLIYVRKREIHLTKKQEEEEAADSYD